jgi:hypothetical protein
MRNKRITAGMVVQYCIMGLILFDSIQFNSIHETTYFKKEDIDVDIDLFFNAYD